MEILMGYLSSKLAAYVGGSIAVFVVAWVLKKVPNEKIKMVIGEIMYNAGVFVTLGLSKWSVTAKIWNKTIEPWLVDLIDNVIGEGVKQFIRGLRSDNKAG